MATQVQRTCSSEAQVYKVWTKISLVLHEVMPLILWRTPVKAATGQCPLSMVGISQPSDEFFF